MATRQFGEWIKAVVDVEREIMGIGGELHADIEALLLERGSRQEDLWGINIYPAQEGDELIEFNSMINVRPSQNNRSRGVESVAIQQKIRGVVARMIV